MQRSFFFIFFIFLNHFCKQEASNFLFCCFSQGQFLLFPTALYVEIYKKILQELHNTAEVYYWLSFCSCWHNEPSAKAVLSSLASQNGSK